MLLPIVGGLLGSAVALINLAVTGIFQLVSQLV